MKGIEMQKYIAAYENILNLKISEYPTNVEIRRLQKLLQRLYVHFPLILKHKHYFYIFNVLERRKKVKGILRSFLFSVKLRKSALWIEASFLQWDPRYVHSTFSIVCNSPKGYDPDKWESIKAKHLKNGLDSFLILQQKMQKAKDT